MSRLESISAITFFVAEMARSTAFYEALGFERLYGGPEADFTSYGVGGGYLNLALRAKHGAAGESAGEAASAEPIPADWGRAIFYVADVDAMHARIVAAGFTPEFAPRDAFWNERYFHVRDPDGHELSFARPLER